MYGFVSLMPDLNDDNLDLLLREHYRAELDGQLDRAPAVQARSSRRLPWRAVGWSTLAVAAAVTIFMMPALRALIGQALRNDPRLPLVTQTAAAQPVEHEVQWKTIDQGTVFVNDELPMRSIRRERLDHIRWTDPDTNATYQMSIPNQETVLVGLRAN